MQYPTGCSHLLPKIRRKDVVSGFSNEFFQHILTKYTLTEKLLPCVVVTLLDSQHITEPYNASCIDLGTILQKTTDGDITKCLMKWHIEMKEGDVIEAVKYLNDSQVDVLEALLTCLKSDINVACNEALKQQKKNFVIALMKRGATPAMEQLCKVDGLLEDPVFQTYLINLKSSVPSTELVRDAPAAAEKKEEAKEEFFSETVSIGGV